MSLSLSNEDRLPALILSALLPGHLDGPATPRTERGWWPVIRPVDQTTLIGLPELLHGQSSRPHGRLRRSQSSCLETKRYCATADRVQRVFGASSAPEFSHEPNQAASPAIADASCEGKTNQKQPGVVATGGRAQRSELMTPTR